MRSGRRPDRTAAAPRPESNPAPHGLKAGRVCPPPSCKRKDWLCCQSCSVPSVRIRTDWRSRSHTKDSRPRLSDCGCERRLQSV